MSKLIALKWSFDQGLYFAHAAEGLWTIEQNRHRFRLTLDPAGVPTGRATQSFGFFASSALAKAEAARSHRQLRGLL